MKTLDTSKMTKKIKSEFDEFLREIEKEQLKDSRLKEQKDNKDYSYEENGRIEICNDCKSHINSHGHCPRCDY